MAKKLSDVMAQLPPERRAKIEARVQALIAENMTLQDMRKARKLTQESMAELLGIRQDSVSRLEKRADLLLSTLRSYVKAMANFSRYVEKSTSDLTPQPPSLQGKGEKSKPLSL
ncbi:helix-turn-helix domain-containing protein [Anabaena azotica]|uniref:XRE family transcriptional regulator n=1 Tax=Anabaena azotica FACHB-119 TaxID=947527 RepID=A0ABR8DBW7_9NOST|nr:helix-turn-helix domain-containing protein [Anabaena azotica]MBD2503228.1 XRE family transcriptional regulator [Anabaena azotica FACHB-119]